MRIGRGGARVDGGLCEDGLSVLAVEHDLGIEERTHALRLEPDAEVHPAQRAADVSHIDAVAVPLIACVDLTDAAAIGVASGVAALGLRQDIPERDEIAGLVGKLQGQEATMGTAQEPVSRG